MSDVEPQGEDKREDKDQDWPPEHPRPQLPVGAPALPMLAHAELCIQDMGVI